MSRVGMNRHGVKHPSQEGELRARLVAFALISDEELRWGQSAIEQAALDERVPSPVIEIIELLRFESV